MQIIIYKLLISVTITEGKFNFTGTVILKYRALEKLITIFNNWVIYIFFNSRIIKTNVSIEMEF